MRPGFACLAAILFVLAMPAMAQQTMVPDATALAVQEGLTSLGYDPGPTDGKPGPATIAAVEAYQRDHQLPVDGQVTRAPFNRHIISTHKIAGKGRKKAFQALY
jgi:peptidoglycan hydrolase-like protein with peptidoglycan-binding domain